MNLLNFLTEQVGSLNERIAQAAADIKKLRDIKDTVELRKMTQEVADIRLAVIVPRNSKARKSIYKAIRYLELRIAKMKKDHK